MHCSSCGKNIPFSGKVCPHCLRDKGSDQGTHIIGVVAMMVGGSIGGALGGFGGTIIGALVLALPVATLGAVRGARTPSKPPKVRMETAKPSPKKAAPNPAPLDNASERLSRLGDLLAKGLISQDEHDRQRAAIIGGI